VCPHCDAGRTFLNNFLITRWIVSIAQLWQVRDLQGAHYLNAVGTEDTRAANAEDVTPPSRASLLVVPGSSETDLDLIHASQRLAAALNMDWVVVFVQPSTFRFLPDRDRDRRLEIMRLAESLGGEAVTLHGTAVARTIAAYARLRQAGKILMSSPARLGWQALTHYSRVITLKRHAPGIEVIAIAPRVQAVAAHYSAHRELDPQSAPRPPLATRCSGYLWSLGITALCTAAALPIYGHVDLINVVMLYMLGAAAAGLWLGRGPSALAAVANVLAFDYYYEPPRFSFMVQDSAYLVTFAVMLLVALIIANLMIAVREQTEAAGAREQHAAAMYAISRELAVTRDAASMARVATQRIAEELQCSALILFCDEATRLKAAPVAARGSGPPAVDRSAAQWAASTQQRAGMGTRQYPSDPAMYLPLVGAHAAIGVLVVERIEGGGNLLPEQQRLLEAFAGQLASALERARLTDIAHAAHLAAERAALRNTLLASISHDLRTPLSAIAGAGSIVAQNDFALDIYRRVTLGRLIEEKARDMSELLSNVLELVRLESGADVLNRDWHTLNDLIGMAISRHESRLTGWRVIIDVPEDLPMLSVDASLFVQLLGNLLENAAKYTPPDTCITVSAQPRGAAIRLVVEDNGPGWATDQPDRLFEKFSRGKSESSAGGIGLGLAICKAVVRLHDGQIRAAEAQGGGARVEIDVPAPELA
jgi:two-component system sensor histidine kinase KdpD